VLAALTDSTSYVLKISLIFQDKFAGQASALYSKVALPIFLKNSHGMLIFYAVQADLSGGPLRKAKIL
jgi:hypothetical protein